MLPQMPMRYGPVFGGGFCGFRTLPFVKPLYVPTSSSTATTSTKSSSDNNDETNDSNDSTTTTTTTTTTTRRNLWSLCGLSIDK